MAKVKKESGILLPISSLKGNYSIGSFGCESKKFIDFLQNNGFTWWQLIPLCITDKYNSPYNTSSSYSIDPFYIDLENLHEQGLISKDELISEQTDNFGKCNYFKLNQTRLKLLYSAYKRFSDYQVLQKFSNNRYISEFCKYQALSHINKSDNWREWKKDLAFDDYFFWLFLQYEGHRQYSELKKYANSKGIKIMGDLPMYSSYFSSEVYFHYEYYQLDEQKNPLFLSGARPDGFSSTGQCWGHPVYDWHKIAKDDFKFWLDKIAYAAEMYDGIRFDHFRGFESYWAIPANNPNALKGAYKPCPGKELFIRSKPFISNKTIVGEDLGVTSFEVQKLIDCLGFNNMRVFQYILDENNSKDTPENYTEKCIAYTGTHDNQTLVGYLNSLSEESKNILKSILKIRNQETLFDCVIRNMYESNAGILIFPIQDVLKLDNNYILNNHIPSKNNWRFRINNELMKNESSIRMFAEYNRKDL